MKRIILTIFSLLIFSFANALDLDEMSSDLSICAVSKEKVETLNLKALLAGDDSKLVVFTHHSDCIPTNGALKTLYENGVIDSLIEEDCHLIIISGGYPVLTNKSNNLGDVKSRIIEDFEIYYDPRQNCFNSIGVNVCQHFVLIENGVVEFEIIGNTENLSSLFQSEKTDTNLSKKGNNR